MNSADGALGYVVFVLKPRKEARKYPAHIVDGHFAGLPAALKIRQVGAYVVGGNRCDRLCGVSKKMLDSCTIVSERLLRTTLNAFSRYKRINKGLIPFVAVGLSLALDNLVAIECCIHSLS